ncbi:acyl-CoA N-acyltransferase [Mycena filopes]|nr:acyl-CoA N-acyltransferase [Mycena filopes]
MHPQYEIFPIPHPPPDADLASYIHLRLLALKTNPEAYGSTFARESLNTQEEWRARIGNAERVTIIARTAAAFKDSDAKFEDSDADINSEEGEGEGEWVGTASIITPELMRAHTGDPTLTAHLVVGMWVHPKHRRRGLAKRLVEFGVDWVRERTDGMPDERRRVTLEVHRDNVGARALYHELGFVESTEEECEDPSRVLMFVVAK